MSARRDTVAYRGYLIRTSSMNHSCWIEKEQGVDLPRGLTKRQRVKAIDELLA